MIKNILRILLSGIFVFTFFSSVGSAALFSGKVSSVDSDTKMLTLEVTNVKTGEISLTEMWVNEDAAFDGFPSLDDVKKGDSVWVEAEQDSEGNWKAGKVAKA